MLYSKYTLLYSIPYTIAYNIHIYIYYNAYQGKTML